MRREHAQPSRPYRPEDFPGIERVHDRARRVELRYAELEDAFLPLRIAAEREDLFAYPGLFVAELGRGDRRLCRLHAGGARLALRRPRALPQGRRPRARRARPQRFPGIRHVEVLSGNAPAQALYARLGFVTAATERGRMPGNEAFSVQVDCMERR